LGPLDGLILDVSLTGTDIFVAPNLTGQTLASVRYTIQNNTIPVLTFTNSTSPYRFGPPFPPAGLSDGMFSIDVESLNSGGNPHGNTDCQADFQLINV